MQVAVHDDGKASGPSRSAVPNSRSMAGSGTQSADHASPLEYFPGALCPDPGIGPPHGILGKLQPCLPGHGDEARIVQSAEECPDAGPGPRPLAVGQPGLG